MEIWDRLSLLCIFNYILAVAGAIVIPISAVYILNITGNFILSSLAMLLFILVFILVFLRVDGVLIGKNKVKILIGAVN